MNWDYESIINLSTNSVAFSDDMCLSGGGSWHTKKSKHFFYTQGFVYNKIIPHGWNTINGRWSRRNLGTRIKNKGPKSVRQSWLVH